MDQEFYRRHSVTEMKEDSSKTLSAAARRSFFRRKQKHKRSSSKDSKEMVALDTISTDSIPFFDGERTFQNIKSVALKISSLNIFDWPVCVCVCFFFFVHSECVSLAYQRVQKVECTSPRPVLILGPLTDPVKEMLVKESPGKFCRCILGELIHRK